MKIAKRGSLGQKKVEGISAKSPLTPLLEKGGIFCYPLERGEFLIKLALYARQGRGGI